MKVMEARFALPKRFILARLHSLTGIVPLGAFLLEHLYSNAVAMHGAAAYNRQVATLQGIPFVAVLEVVLIFIPLLYHAIYGLSLAFLSRHNVGSYGYQHNWRFFLQRLSGIVTLVFVVYHLWAIRVQALVFGTEVNFQAVAQHVSSPWIFSFYVLGVISTAFHFSNGLWAGLITWGFTVGQRAQRRSAIVLMLVFALLSLIGVGSLAAFLA